jgi:hypothetical protein
MIFARERESGGGPCRHGIGLLIKNSFRQRSGEEDIMDARDDFESNLFIQRRAERRT